MLKVDSNNKSLASIFFPTASIVLIIALILVLTVRPKSRLEIEFVRPTISNDVAMSENICEIFYTTTNEKSGSKHKMIKDSDLLNPDVSSAKFTLPSDIIKGLRIDIGTMPKEWNIKSITLRIAIADKQFFSHSWLPQDIAEDFEPLNSIDEFTVCDGLLFINASGIDPFFGYKGDFSKIYCTPLKNMRNLKIALSITISIALIILFICGGGMFSLLASSFKLNKRLSTSFTEVKFIFPLWIWITLFVIAIVKIWLLGHHMFPAINSPHDDELFLKLARNIVSGNWLGGYNNVTILKQPFYPIWVATMFFLGIPLAFSQHVLYVSACVLFVIAILPLLRNKPWFILIVYVSLVFHPISYSGHQMARSLRAGIYISLVLMVMSLAIGLLLRKDAPLKTLKKWFVGFGFALGAFWLTREEGIILLPAVFILLFVYVVSIIRSSQNKWKRIKLCFISFIIPILMVYTIAGINKVKYGVFTTSEQKQSDFVNAYSSLIRVKSMPYKRYLPVPREKRERIYAISPAFAELRPFLEGDGGKGWAQWGPYAGEDISTHFMFALRDAVVFAGHGESGGDVAKYYRRLAEEVNKVCDDGLIECHPRPNPFLPKSAYNAPWRKENLKLLLRAYKQVLVSAAKLEYIINMPHLGNSGSDKVESIFRDMTRSRVVAGPSNPTVLETQNKLDSVKINILDFMLSFYRYYMRFLVYGGIIAYGWHLIATLLKRKITYSFIIMTALLVAVLARFYLLALVEITLASSFKHAIMYKSSFFPLLTAFSIVSIIGLFLKCDEKYSLPLNIFRRKK